MQKTNGRENADFSLAAKDQYMREVRWSEQFAEGEERSLLQVVNRAKADPGNQWLAMRAKHARDRLVEGYQPMVIAHATRLAFYAQRWGLEISDLVQEGNIGLLEAIDTDGRRSCSSIRALAGVCIRHEMLKAVIERGGVVPLPAHVRKALVEAKKAETSLEMSLGRRPLLREVAAEIGIKEHILFSYKEYGRRGDVASFQTLLVSKLADGQDNEEDRLDLVSVFQTPDAVGNGLSEELVEAIRQAVDALSPQQRETVKLRYGFDEGAGELRKWDVVADHLGCGRTTVNKHWVRARQRLQGVLAPLVDEAV